MGTKKKVGKDRLDKFYHLAKEQGYRSRAAFKLIQLAKKHDFFSSAQVCIDLCAAPGGWMQVAQKHMPIASKIIGIDLCPIKAIRGCTAIQADITTARCRNILRKELQGLSADVVLHDGAPNTGTSWVHDAYVQNELVLHSFKLATEFLRPGGHFITKVFRSIDYNSLLWVFQQFFHRVEATKPQASRNVSAEIFVMCMGYKNPAHIDPKFFDPLHVFAHEDDSAKRAAEAAAELDDTDETGKKRRKSTGLAEAINSVGKRNRGGYEEGDDHRVITAKAFLDAVDPAKLLIKTHTMDLKSDTSIEGKFILNHPLTTENIHELAQDIKVLGKRDLSILLTWRYKLLKERNALEKQRRKEAKHDDTDEDGSDFDSDDSSQNSEQNKTHKKKVHATTDKSDEKGSIAKMVRASLTPDQDDDSKLQQLIEERRRAEKRDAKKLKEKLRKREHRHKMSMGGFIAGENEDPELFRLDASMLQALAKEDEVLARALEKAKSEGKDFDGVLHDLLDDSDFSDSTLNEDDIDSSDLENMDHDERRILLLEKSLAERHVIEKEDTRIKRNAAKKAKREEATRREKVTAEWAKEIQSFDKYIDDEAERVLQQRNEEMFGSSSDEEEIEDGESDGNMSESIQSEDEEHAQPIKRSKTTVSPTVSGLSLSAKRWLSNPLMSSIGKGDYDPEFSNELADEDLVQLPLTEKQKAKLKRAKDQARKEKRATKKARKEAEASGISFDASAGSEFSTVPSASSFVDVEKPSEVGKFAVVPRQVFAPSYDDSSDEEDYNDQQIEETPEHLKKPNNRDDLIAIQSLGAMMIHKRTRMDLIDGAWNRFAWHDDENVPDWFIEDDIIHSQPQLPLTKEVAKELRQKFKDIAARPIRKEQEALARKKKKAEKRLDRAKKAAEAVSNESDLSELSKAQTIRKIMRKATTSEKKEKVYAVGNKSGGLREGSKGKSGKNTSTVVVDKRLKKDKRAARFQRKRK